ncbi:MAG: LysM peptidoglycan-binding domain-containing protein [Clostridia bacterium]|nr:LysM peptidoglycan-binding domain-containing protein [Clostridia bacterium]
MKIHIFKSGDTTELIAKEYGTTSEMISVYNSLDKSSPAIGEELIILTPTRTYKTRVNDTLERISLRFAVKKNKLISINPGIGEGALPVGRELALRFSESCYGTALANGYFYNGCTEDKLRAVLPYLTYITFSVAKFDGGGVVISALPKGALELCRESGKIPLIRIYEENKSQKYKNPDLFINECIRVAKLYGFKGITINLEGEVSERCACEFLIRMRKRLIGCDLILITEINERSGYEFTDYSDGSVICYPKLAMNEPPSFAEGERAIFSEFATRGESAKTFIDLATLAKCRDSFYDIQSVIRRVRGGRGEILHDDERMLSQARLGGEEYIFTPPSNIKAILDLVYEYGYMGISFDIMRIPMSYLYMYGAMFSTMAYSGIIEHGRCGMDG